jgi:hypothetical protein
LVHRVRGTAEDAGPGLTAVPASMIPAALVRAKEYYLPELPPIETLLCGRLGFETDQVCHPAEEIIDDVFHSRSQCHIAG